MEFKLSFKCTTRDNLQIALLLFFTMVQCHETQIQTASSTLTENSLGTNPLVATIAQEEYYESQMFETQIQPNDLTTSLKAAPLVAISTTGTVQDRESQFLETQIPQSNVATLMTTAPSATRFTANRAQKSDVGVLQTSIKLRFGATSTDATPLDTTLTSVEADYSESHFLETQIQPNVAETSVISTLLAAKSMIMQTEYDSQDIGTQIQPKDGTFTTSRQVENDSQFETQIQPTIVKSMMGLVLEYDSQILDTISTNMLSKFSGVIKTILRTISEFVLVVQAVETKSISSRQLGRKYFFLRRNPSSWGKN